MILGMKEVKAQQGRKRNGSDMWRPQDWCTKAWTFLCFPPMTNLTVFSEGKLNRRTHCGEINSWL